MSEQHTADYSGSQGLLSPQKIDASGGLLADTPGKSLKAKTSATKSSGKKSKL